MLYQIFLLLQFLPRGSSWSAYSLILMQRGVHALSRKSPWHHPCKQAMPLCAGLSLNLNKKANSCRGMRTLFTELSMRSTGAHEGNRGWTTRNVPRNYNEVENAMVNSLQRYLTTSQTTTGKRVSIDVLTPGLNRKLEQKAILNQEYLFDLVIATIPALSFHFENIQLAFQSMGDAAGFQKYTYQKSANVPDNVDLTEIGMRYANNRIQCMVIVAASNNVGNPVIREIQEICAEYPDTTYIFLNCDLSDKVASGMRDRSIRDHFRNSIKPIYYFRNIVRMQRPSLNPIEVGAISFSNKSSRKNGNSDGSWEIFAVNDEDIWGPGSLNRFMKVPAFRKNPKDPTALAPPRFIKVSTLEEAPSRSDLDTVMSRASFLNAKYERDQRIKETIGLKSGSAEEDILVDSIQTAVDVLNYTVNGFKDGKPLDIARACVYLDVLSGVGSFRDLGIADASVAMPSAVLSLPHTPAPPPRSTSSSPASLGVAATADPAAATASSTGVEKDDAVKIGVTLGEITSKETSSAYLAIGEMSAKNATDYNRKEFEADEQKPISKLRSTPLKRMSMIDVCEEGDEAAGASAAVVSSYTAPVSAPRRSPPPSSSSQLVSLTQPSIDSSPALASGPASAADDLSEKGYRDLSGRQIRLLCEITVDELDFERSRAVLLERYEEDKDGKTLRDAEEEEENDAKFIPVSSASIDYAPGGASSIVLSFGDSSPTFGTFERTVSYLGIPVAQYIGKYKWYTPDFDLMEPMWLSPESDTCVVFVRQKLGFQTEEISLINNLLRKPPVSEKDVKESTFKLLCCTFNVEENIGSRPGVDSFKQVRRMLLFKKRSQNNDGKVRYFLWREVD